jgi:hypothetical protein
MDRGQMADTIVEVDILEFLRTGSFGPVGFGMSRAQLEELLGPADDVGIAFRKDKHPTIFKYGDIEFYIDSAQDRLYAIHSDYFTILEGNARLQLEMHGIDSRTTFSQTKEILHRASIRFSEQVNAFGISELVTEGNVTLGFGDDEFDDEPVERDGCLGAISRFNYDVLARQQPTKQVAITIPETTYELIRTKALRQGISIAKLCSRWVVEAAEQQGLDQQ